MNRQHTQTSQKSGIRLMELLSSRSTEIIRQENNNERAIYLYGIGGYWVAFEKSAYQLCKVCPQSKAALLNFTTYPFPIVMVSIAEKELREYFQRHIFRKNEPDYKVLSVPELSQASYRRWHQQEIKKLMKDRSICSASGNTPVSVN